MCGKNAYVCNGVLLTVGQVQAFINTATQLLLWRHTRTTHTCTR